MGILPKFLWGMALTQEAARSVASPEQLALHDAHKGTIYDPFESNSYSANAYALACADPAFVRCMAQLDELAKQAEHEDVFTKDSEKPPGEI